MIILSHRGYWASAEQKNTEAAFRKSFLAGFGTETDVRDKLGELVISHDPPTMSSMSFLDFLVIYRSINESLPLALNIKADGLQPALKKCIDQGLLENYFLFDMSVPDALSYANARLRFFTRQSEIERVPCLYETAAGVWMDMFFDDWIEEYDVQSHLKTGKQVCLVSPELHKREHTGFWNKLSDWDCLDDSKLMICTDFPDEAKSHFEL
jgi:hypothetical protein